MRRPPVLVAQRIFLRCTAISETSAESRRTAALTEFLHDGQPESTRQILNRLADARLLVIDGDTVEIAHEALIREWPLLRDWLTRDRDILVLHRRIHDAARDWNDQRRPSDLLLRGERLALAIDLKSRDDSPLNALESDFVAHSEDAQANELVTTRRRNRRLRLIAGVLCVLAVLSLAGGGTAWWQYHRAQNAHLLAVSRTLAARAQNEVTRSPQLAMLQALTSVKIESTSEGRQAILEMLRASPHLHGYLNDHRGTVWSVNFSPDGRIAASADQENAILWNVEQRKPIRVLSSTEQVVFNPHRPVLALVKSRKTDTGAIDLWGLRQNRVIGSLRRSSFDAFQIGDVDFSPNGRYLAAATLSPEQIVLVWDLDHPGRAPQTFKDQAYYGLAFGPDSRLLVAVANDSSILGGGTVEVLDLDAGKVERSIKPPKGRGPTHQVWLSPDGHTLAWDTPANDIVLLNFHTGQQIGLLQGHKDLVSAAAFSPDGSLLATGSADTTIRVWDVRSKRLLATMAGHSDNVSSLSFSPDSRRLISGSDGETALWSVMARPQIRTLADFGQLKSALYLPVQITPDGRPVIVQARRNGVQVEDVTSGMPETASAAQRFDLSPDERTVVEEDGKKAHLRTVPAGESLLTFSGIGPDSFLSWDFAPRGDLLAYPVNGNNIAIWDVANRKQTALIPEHVARTVSPGWSRFSGDGKKIAARASDTSIALFDSRSGKRIRVFASAGEFIADFEFSPDGQLMAATHLDHTITVWNTRDGSMQAFLTDLAERRKDGGLLLGPEIRFSPDSQLIAGVADDGSVVVWGRDGSRQADLSMPGPWSPLEIEFSPDSRLIVAGRYDGILAVWDVRGGPQPLITLREAQSPVRRHWFREGTRQLLWLHEDGKLRSLELDFDHWYGDLCQLVGRNLTETEWQQHVPDVGYRSVCP
ncbi:WD40 repeat domain-containing protein [Spongiactinospora sp. 9N601]|uniref:WD40 repeat domain-containing protein n=1 Tax=Spongiactinospora sp. 9N601 TaxID=3375149 RepID=UPI00378DA447